MRLIKTLTASLTVCLAALSGSQAYGQPSPPAIPQPATTVAGIMVYNESWDSSSPESGVYYIEVKPGGAITPVYKSPAMADVVTALKKDNIMYTAEATSDYRYYYRQMNISDWSTVGNRQEIDMEDVPAALTYDASLGKAYGSFWNENYGGFSFFGDFNLTSASWTSIDKAQRDERDIFALAADGKGTIYCLFGAFNYVATLDPVSGQINRIKTTGFEIDTNWADGRVSSMCYDLENDRLIATVAETLGWGATKSYRSGLYTIDPHSGAVEKVMDFDGNACFAGLYVVDAADSPTAPAQPSGLAVNIDGTATQGTVSFTMPDKTMGGTAITGDLIAILNVNGTETAIFNLKPGQAVVSDMLQFNKGVNTLKVTVADSERRGGSESIEFWAGEDSPVAVDEVNLEIVDGKGVVSWSAPTEGQHGGPLAPDAIAYKVVRQPDNVVVADNCKSTSVEDGNIDTSYKIIYYTVTAFNGEGESEATESNRCLSFGSFPVPFTEGFDTADDFALWTIENVNGGFFFFNDTATTEKTAEYKYDDNKLAADDWLISPPIRLEEGKSYKLSYSWRAMNKYYPESFEVMLGTEPAAASMKSIPARHEKVSNTSYQTAEQSITVDRTGNYYLGIHCFSDAWMYILRVDDISIVEIDNRVPAQVDDLEVAPADKGGRSATVRFTVPKLDNKGDRLEAVASAVLSRDGATIATFDNVKPGDAVEYEDKDVTTDGVKKYSVVCSNENGSGVEAVKEVYVGVDAPGAVANLTIAEVDKHPSMKWEAPAEGANGGWFDAEAVVYRIVRSDGTVVTEDCPTTEFTDLSYTSPSKGQDAVWYLVTPYVGTTKGNYAQTELLLCGPAYTVPAVETFPDADMNFYPWIAQSDNAVNYSWTLDNMGYNPQTADQNGDRGLATFHSVGEPEGTVSCFYSPKFDISALANPVLSFYLYHAPGEGDGSMELLISAGTDTFAPLQGSTKIMRSASEGWQRYTVDLSSYASAPWIRIGFKGTGDGVADIYLDNVSIEDQVPVDLAVTTLSAPRMIAADEMIPATVTVLNNGSQPVANAKLTVSDGQGNAGETIDLPTLQPGQTAKALFEVKASAIGRQTIVAEVVADGDGNDANNSMTVTVDVVKAMVNAPTITDGALEDGILTLKWDDPVADGVITDDVESYTDFAIDGIGDWTMWDGDYDYTYMISTSHGDYPNSTARKAFQVCNADVLGINIWDEGKPKSGNKMFMAMANSIYVNNDWLISPQLNGKEQWISFFARSFTLQNTPPERMRVWYSTTDNDPANFIELTSSYVELPGTWQEYSYFLPEGAKYFAINCVSDGSFAMFVDDISFNDLSVPTWTIQGYEIYRNGEKIGETTANEFSGEVDDTEGSYSVKAVYDRGEGPMSDAVVLGRSGIADVMQSGVSAYGSTRSIIVRNADGRDCEIFSIAGQLILRDKVVSDNWTVSVAPGIYIVKVGADSFKLMVK